MNNGLLVWSFPRASPYHLNYEFNGQLFNVEMRNCCDSLLFKDVDTVYLVHGCVTGSKLNQSWWCSHFAGLNAGDEILQLNGKDAHSLNFSDMKAAFSQASLALTVNTLPSVDRRQLCYLPPRRSDAEEDLYTDIFSQSQGEKSQIKSILMFLFPFTPLKLHLTTWHIHRSS